MVAPVTLLYLLQAPLFTLGVGVPVGRGVSGLAAARAVVGRAVGVAVVVAPVPESILRILHSSLARCTDLTHWLE